jgi:hypothetical protein
MRTVIAAVTGTGWLLTFAILVTGTLPLAAVLSGISLAATVLLIATFRSGYVIDSTNLRHTTWRYRRDYPRAAFLSAEFVEDTRGKSGLLVRFQTGAVLLSPRNGCSDPRAAQAFLDHHWQDSPGAHDRASTGPVNENLVLEYESLHLVRLAALTVFFAALSAAGPMFWVAALVALFTGRALYRPFKAPIRMRWDKISSVRFWHSLAHGGMILSDGTNQVRIYRWIRDYPRFNRLVQDNIPAASFAPVRGVPWMIALNHRKRVSLLLLMIVAGVSVWLAANDLWPIGLFLFMVPAASLGLSILATGRKLEIHPEGIRVIEKKSFVKSTHTYQRANLDDMRIGRQLSAGGLWLKFGNERLEIGNIDSSVAPEEILRVLRQEWKWDSSSESVHPESRAA